MNSKEALERLYNLVCKFSPFLPFNLYEPIKQDLDRLEQLEKENQELKNEKDIALEKSRENWAKYQKECDDVTEYLLVIEKKNEELIRYEKALDILKEKFALELGVSVVKERYCYSLEFLFNNSYFSITKEEYELLKEVLEDD